MLYVNKIKRTIK